MSFLVAGIASASLSLIGGGIAAGRAARAQRLAEAKERESRDEMDRLKGVYASLDTSNPFLNMENTMEDLTVNQQQAQFQAQQFQQSQADILGGLRNVAGGSGIAALAQTLANQGMLQQQRGVAMVQGMEFDRQATQLGMSMQMVGNAQDAIAANKAMWGNIIGSVTSAFVGGGMDNLGAGKGFFGQDR